jgi:spore germination cell wall hydrolase CwlJ-like protein
MPPLCVDALAPVAPVILGTQVVWTCSSEANVPNLALTGLATFALLAAGGATRGLTSGAPQLPTLHVRPPAVPEVTEPAAKATAEAVLPAGDTEPGSRPAAPMRASAGDLEILARIVKGECPPSTPFAGKVAVAAVALNRVRSGRFPTSIRAVAHQPKQFSCYNASNRARLYHGPIPSDAWKAARAALDGEDPTDGCMFFFNPFLVQPGWARRLEFVRRIGTARSNTHDFYRYEPLGRR